MLNRLKGILPLLLGIFILYGAFSFIGNLQLLNQVGATLRLPFVVLAIIIIGTSGFGIEIGIRLIFPAITRPQLLGIACIYSVYFFILQLFFTVVPANGACHCLTWFEILTGIRDWWRVEYAGFTMLVASVVFWGYSRNNRDKGLGASVPQTLARNVK